MPSQNKLIKQGIRYTDALFKEISNRLSVAVLESDTLEDFLEKTSEYTTANPLTTTGYDSTMINLILAETNNHKFSRPAQRELTRITIDNYVGDLIQDVGEDIKTSVRDIVRDGYDQGLSQKEIAENITNKVDTIKNSRARTIARTEIARTASVSDYIINKERGATHFTVTCRETRCELCQEEYCDGNDTTGGDVLFSIDDIDMLPPLHPNCRCTARYQDNSERADYIRSQIQVR